MRLDTYTYSRKPFDVEAIQVTEANMEHVAKWCKGTIITDEGSKHIYVDVHHPHNERQKKAYVGDWVLYSNVGFFKIYTQKAFLKSFDRKDDVTVEEIPQEAGSISMDAEAVQEAAKRTDEVVSS